MQGLTFCPTHLTYPHQDKDSYTEILPEAQTHNSRSSKKFLPDVLAASSQNTSVLLSGGTGTSRKSKYSEMELFSLLPSQPQPSSGSEELQQSLAPL